MNRPTLLTTWALTLAIATTTTATATTLITSAQIRDNTITSADIKRNTITPSRLTRGTAVWLTDTSTQTTTATVPTGNSSRQTPSCGTLGYATGGGASAGDNIITINESYPAPGNHGWTTTITNEAGAPITATFYVQCSTPVIG